MASIENGPTTGKIEESSRLSGQMLIAAPSMLDPRFAGTVVYLCSHGPDGAMGLIINRIYGNLDFKGLLSQLNLTLAAGARELPIHFGGPVEPARGFVLHTTDVRFDGSMIVDEKIALTATVDIMRALSEGSGPAKVLLALGYAGWGAGQLEAELQTNGWLISPPDESIIFADNTETSWERALKKIGVSPIMLSTDVGHA